MDQIEDTIEQRHAGRLAYCRQELEVCRVELQRLRSDLEAEQNRNRSLWEENKRLTDALKESQASAELAMRRVTEENERLREALKEAPHANGCDSRKPICVDCGRATGKLGSCHGKGEVVNGRVLEGAQYSEYTYPYPCSCFKRALSGSPEPTVQLSEVSDDEAYKQIRALFQPGAAPWFYDTICDRLRLPLEQVIQCCNRLEQEGVIGSPEPAPHVENATGKPKVACIKCGDTGWLTGPGHDGEACECNQINPPCKTCGGTKLIQRGVFLSDQADKPCPDCAPAEGDNKCLS